MSMYIHTRSQNRPIVPEAVGHPPSSANILTWWCMTLATQNSSAQREGTLQAKTEAERMKHLLEDSMVGLEPRTRYQPEQASWSGACGRQSLKQAGALCHSGPASCPQRHVERATGECPALELPSSWP